MRATAIFWRSFNPGQGIFPAATLKYSGTRIYLLSNGGTLYALDIV